MSRNKRILVLTVLFIMSFIFLLILKVVLAPGANFGDINDNAASTSKYNNNLNNCGWIPNWAAGDGLQSMHDNAGNLDCISPVLFEVNNNGSLKNVSPGNLNKIIKEAQSDNMEIYPTIAMFDHEIFTPILQNEENFKRHVAALIAITDNPGFAGIDLDYESTKLSDKDKYDEFIRQLSAGLHARGKKLIVTVLSQWGDDVEYPSLKETHKVQDWRFLADYADQIRIMAYDYTYTHSKYPGPIAPLSWVESILKYAKTKIPDEKIVLGIPFYSYQWAVAGDNKINLDGMPFNFINDYLKNPYDDKAAVSSYDYTVVKSIIAANKGQTLGYEGENVFIYQKYVPETQKYENRVLVYLDQTSILLRKKLAARYNAYGVVFWRLGKEDNLLKEI